MRHVGLMYVLLSSTVLAWEYECRVFQKRSPGCQLVLQQRLQNIMTSGNWTADGTWVAKSYSRNPLIRKRSVLSSCLSRRILFFAGSSFTRVMLLDFLEELTGEVQDPHIGSRHPKKFCSNLDGYDIKTCGWPSSKWWLLGRQAGRAKLHIVKEASFASPPTSFPVIPGKDQWMVVFQFKTFVRTPELDTEILRQARGYQADLLVIETGVWGFLPSSNETVEEQSRKWIKSVQEEYTASNVIVMMDGFHYGMIGPHVVHGAVARNSLFNISWDAGFIRFDRTDMLRHAALVPALSDSMAAHGYSGAVSKLHALMLFSFLCNAV